MIIGHCSEVVMSISRSQVGCLLLLLLSISVLNYQVLGARFVKEEMEHVMKNYEVWRKGFANERNEGSYAAVNRVVPSSPDPLHNRSSKMKLKKKDQSAQWKKLVCRSSKAKRKRM